MCLQSSSDSRRFCKMSENKHKVRFSDAYYNVSKIFFFQIFDSVLIFLFCRPWQFTPTAACSRNFRDGSSTSSWSSPPRSSWGTSLTSRVSGCSRSRPTTTSRKNWKIRPTRKCRKQREKLKKNWRETQTLGLENNKKAPIMISSKNCSLVSRKISNFVFFGLWHFDFFKFYLFMYYVIVTFIVENTCSDQNCWWPFRFECKGPTDKR